MHCRFRNTCIIALSKLVKALFFLIILPLSIHAAENTQGVIDRTLEFPVKPTAVVQIAIPDLFSDNGASAGAEFYRIAADLAVSEIGKEFKDALAAAARFVEVSLDYPDSAEDVQTKTIVENQLLLTLFLTDISVETVPQILKTSEAAPVDTFLFQAEVQLSALLNADGKEIGYERSFGLLGQGISSEEAVRRAVKNLRYGISSLIVELPLPGPQLKISEIFNRSAWMLLSESEAAGAEGSLYQISTGSGAVLGLAEVQRTIPLPAGPDQTSNIGMDRNHAAELRILYADSTVVPGMAVTPAAVADIEISAEIAIGTGAVGTFFNINPPFSTGLRMQGSIGALLKHDASSFAVLGGVGYAYRIIPGSRLNPTGWKIIDRFRLQLDAGIIFGYLISWNQTPPVSDGFVSGNRFGAGGSWFLTGECEVFLKGRFEQLYTAEGIVPVHTAFSAAMGVTLHPTW